jgi:cytochrome c-type biogenesis protein
MASTTAQAVFAVGAGTATFFSPCVYALLPGYISYYVASVDEESAPLAGATARGLAATVGAVATFGVLSVLAIVASETVEQAIPIVEPLVGLVLIVLGTLVFWKGAVSLSIPLPERRTSVIGFGLFGAGYAVAATACVLPVFLSVALQALNLGVGGAVVVLGAYAGTFGLLMLAATVATAIGHDAVVGRMTAHSGLLTRAAGVVIVIAGSIQLYVALQVTGV